MDFTSGDVGGNDDNSSRSSSKSELEPEHAHLLQLQDAKELLLAKRNAVVREIESLESDEPPMEFKHTALLDLAELIPTKAKLDTEIRRFTAVQDGHTAVEEEIKYKHDCLPLLNMELRLSYLYETYPYAEVRLLDNSRLHVAFTRRPNDHFEVNLQLPNGPALVSGNVRWSLRELEGFCNPSSILQGCYEFDRLRCKRDEIFEGSCSALQHRNVYHRIGGSLLSLWRGNVLLQLRFDIIFRKKNPFPQTHLSACVFRGELAVISPDVQEILEGLIQEYGVMRGIIQLCRSCFI